MSSSWRISCIIASWLSSPSPCERPSLLRYPATFKRREQCLNRCLQHSFSKLHLSLLSMIIHERALEPPSVKIATFRLEYEDDYEYEFSVLSTRFRFGGENFRIARAQNLKIVLVVVLVLQSKGLY